MKIEAIRPAEAHRTMGYSPAVRVGNTLYISGQVPKDGTDRVVGIGDFDAQVRQVFANLRAVLTEGGGDFANVVKLTTYLTRRDQFEAWRRMRAEAFGVEPLPASTLVVVSGLSNADFLVEIEAIAVLDD